MIYFSVNTRRTSCFVVGALALHSLNFDDDEKKNTFLNSQWYFISYMLMVFYL